MFRTKQGQVQLLPHLAKMRCFFAVMQVSCGTQGPKLKGAYVMGVSKLKVYRTQVFAIFYLLGLQYYPAVLASICTPNCSPQQWCDHSFTQYVRFNLSGLAGEKLFWFQQYAVAFRTPARRFLCFFLAWCLLLQVSLSWTCSSGDVSCHGRASAAVASHTVELRPHRWRLAYFFVTFLVFLWAIPFILSYHKNQNRQKSDADVYVYFLWFPRCHRGSTSAPM